MGDGSSSPPQSKYKTQAIFFAPNGIVNRLIKTGPPGVTLGLETVVPSAETALSLGVVLDRTLSWKPHIDYVINKANRALYSLRFFRSCTTEVLFYTTNTGAWNNGLLLHCYARCHKRTENATAKILKCVCQVHLWNKMERSYYSLPHKTGLVAQRHETTIQYCRSPIQSFEYSCSVIPVWNVWKAPDCLTS